MEGESFPQDSLHLILSPDAHHMWKHCCQRLADSTGSDEALSPETGAGERDISKDWVVGILSRSPGGGVERYVAEFSGPLGLPGS